ncbi:hypothetical protein B0A81_04220 [Flavobacterium plurextorum]|uniref:Uncharacterized protein n=1 Tax=Flavobacterium plurextorum TaxID=1114867 RepID=A0ABX4CYJ2_9FLAO|nr:hypothetical protein B0A81_04220 [Flavobacterium plurextorum]
MVKQRTKKQNKPKFQPKTKSKKPITAYAVIRIIIIILVCLILILGIVAKFIHYFKNHWN